MKRVKSDPSIVKSDPSNFQGLKPSTRMKLDPIPPFRSSSPDTTKTGNVYTPSFTAPPPPTYGNYIPTYSQPINNAANTSFLTGMTTNPSTTGTSVYAHPTSRYLSAPRAESSTQSRILIPQESRPNGDVTKLTKLRISATTPLSNKFTCIPLDDADEQIVNNYNLEMRINELRRKMVQFDMIEVFSILRFPPSPMSNLLIIIQPLSETTDLLSNWDSLTEDVIFTHFRFLQNYGQV